MWAENYMQIKIPVDNHPTAPAIYQNKVSYIIILFKLVKVIYFKPYTVADLYRYCI